MAETGSTNADLVLLAKAGAAEGFWLRTERQTAGRGRQGRAWMSPPGNFYASTLVRLRGSDPQAATLALVAGVALEEAVRVFLEASPVLSQGGLRLKWPNDLLLDGAKLSGILLDRVDDAVIVGIGVNLAHHPDLPDRATTSLAAHGVDVDPAALLDVLAEAFARWVERWRGEGIAAVRARWLERAHPVGTALTARLADGTVIDGLFDGLDPDCALTLRLASGERRVIHAADVFLL
ncbi:biotin--[acetyl-CoA-carboxylase] ligase [Microvirga sp. SRT01]|uniref:biotin--[biotin carboxyl-carrier protein] ligase n=1 Tax=Sphingomonas longa TaxID=2778730 RepID=A0ABS2D2H0_9SPHN|nr:biotin--[acetyl-CoA-carboxylase] ligase [Microvirga sp. SRT01]MBM6575120.1 biotin--[acetyl-CoA-carboxylase] ligase [Sphingomonas sp. BT552]MBR7708171.1 biotin--[acetyl-CoA-carboxylase] ligase [Microvirga sp. SRT01]